MIKIMVIDEDCNEHPLFESEDNTMNLDTDQIALLLCFKDEVTFEIRGGADAC